MNSHKCLLVIGCYSGTCTYVDDFYGWICMNTTSDKQVLWKAFTKVESP